MHQLRQVFPSVLPREDRAICCFASTSVSQKSVRVCRVRLVIASCCFTSVTTTSSPLVCPCNANLSYASLFVRQKNLASCIVSKKLANSVIMVDTSVTLAKVVQVLS